MRFFKNCGKLVYVFCIVGAVFVFYCGVFQFLEQGKVTLPKTLVPSARIFHNGRLDWKQTKEGDKKLTNGRRFNKEDIEKYEEFLHDSDNLDISEENETSEDIKNVSLAGVKSSRKLPEASGQGVFKLLDFNHRTCCPLNYKFTNCEYSACEFTEDPEKADLVMINGARLKLLKLPPRHPGQIWILYTKEPPTFPRFQYLDREDLRNQINWTRCIFRDSTFKGNYGQLTSRLPPEKDYGKIYAKKKYPVAWFVSNCNSQSLRNEYVKRLSSEITVHIFGHCGNKTCGRHGLRLGLYGTKDPCLSQLSTDYMFYLSFENSLCSDYVTEKFYKLYEDVDVVPVVRGGADYTELAPRGTYINAKDFKSPEELGKYLLQLSENKEQYIHMLKLKDRYTTTMPNPTYPCDLCKALHTRRDVPSTYKNILTWMKGHCWEPDDL